MATTAQDAHNAAESSSAMETSGAKGQRVHAKRREVPGDDGWTVVTGPGLNAATQEVARSGKKPARPKHVAAGLTVERLAREFADVDKRWRASACWAGLERMLGRRQTEWNVDAAVCVGLGSCSLDWVHRWRSVWQLALFVNVVRVVQGGADRRVLLYAQDPVFTPLDVEFLGTLSIAVTTDGIEDRITPSSFVYAPFVDWSLLLPRFLKGRDPELYVGSHVKEDYSALAVATKLEKSKRTTLEEVNGVAAAFRTGREERKLDPTDEYAATLEGLMVYWREGAEE